MTRSGTKSMQPSRFARRVSDYSVPGVFYAEIGLIPRVAPHRDVQVSRAVQDTGVAERRDARERPRGVLITVTVGLIRALDRHADVVGLKLAELGQRDAEFRKVQARDLLVQMFG